MSVLRTGGVQVTEPTSARTTSWGPVVTRVPSVLAATAAAIDRELDLVGAGTLGVLAPRSLVDAVREAVPVAGPDAARVAVLTVAEAKGLEFDGVLLLEPAAIRTESPRGLNDLYVAITRPTQRLHVLHADPLPPGFEQA